MTSDPVFVWVWLPGAVDPVVAGALQTTGARTDGEAVLAFRYAVSYRSRPDSISLFTPELPLNDRVHDPTRVTGRDALPLAGCLRDAAPDAWGRRVINLEIAGNPDTELAESLYLLRSGSDRIGALDFQESPTEHVPRQASATLTELMDAANRVEAGQRLPAPLEQALAHGTSIGGARPKALLIDRGRHLIAKFSSSADVRPVVQAEAVAMLLAARAGVQVADVEVVEADGRKVLLVDRFDRRVASGTDGGLERRQMVSMLTVLGLSEASARYGSYAQMAQQIRLGPWSEVSRTLRELFTRLVLNVVVGNTDDHLRNHAAFWEGHRLSLTPAYDIAPQPRTTEVATQAVGITADGNRASQLWVCRRVAPEFLLTHSGADEIIDHVLGTVIDHFDDVCDQARLTGAQRATLWQREINNRYIHYREA